MGRGAKTEGVLFVVGAVLLLVGAGGFGGGGLLWFVIYSVGAVILAPLQLRGVRRDVGVTLRRLYTQQALGALLLVATGVFMAMRVFRFGLYRGNEWIVCLSVACVLELYTAFRIPSELKKEEGG